MSGDYIDLICDGDRWYTKNSSLIDRQLQINGQLIMDEIPSTDVRATLGGKGTVYVLDSAPNELYFKNDAGTIYQLAETWSQSGVSSFQSTNTSRYYWGRTTGGWATSSNAINQALTGLASISEDISQGGIVVPFNCSKINFKSTIQEPSSSGAVIEVTIKSTDRAGGTSGNLANLNNVATGTVTLTDTTQNYSLDVSATGESISIGLWNKYSIYKLEYIWNNIILKFVFLYNN